ncbi:iron reductase [Roridomyces roridus]|uniref:Iron reductase n=1 Tax=Roridomyces roridus TaxID=1738132 RepID=A0AAD7FP92_9AGAR|nr:iron reductase [Roridomyces roridus]
MAKSQDPDRLRRIYLGYLYPKQVWYFLGAFIALVAVCHLVSVVYAHWTSRHASKTRDTSLRHRVSLRRLPLASINLFRTVAFRWSVTIWGTHTFNVADFFLTSTYISILFTWTFINTKSLGGVKYDPKYFANRCGHIAAVQLPLTAALGMKNNVITLLTGVGFDQLEYLHRLSARVICVLAWVHAFGRIYLKISADDLASQWFHLGIMSTSALTLLCFFSIRPIRKRNYEFFLIFHFIFGVLTLVGTYIHVANSDNGGYVWPALLLYGLDVVLRFARRLLVNTHLFGVKEKRRVSSNATVSIISPHFLRILVDAPPYMRWSPGQVVYLTLMAGGLSLAESHPFTIAYSVPMSSDSEKATPERLAFILRVRSGFTRRLFESLDDGSKDYQAFLDGPYSSPPVVRGFERVVFISGGSGVSFTLSLFLDLVHAARKNTNPRCRRILFVWAIRDLDQIDWIKDAVTRALSSLDPESDIDIAIRLHLTSSPESVAGPDDAESSSESDSAAGSGTLTPAGSNEKFFSPEYEPLPGVPNVRLLRGRPDVRTILDEEVEGAKGAVSVNVCGTHALGASVRGALGSRAGRRFVDILRGGPSVMLHVEGYGS